MTRRRSRPENSESSENNKKDNDVKASSAETQPTLKGPVPGPYPIKSRAVACTQSTGRCGKSTTAQGLLTWLSFAGVPHIAFDADGEHRTLSRRHPEEADKFDTANNPDEFTRMMRQVDAELPVTLIDFPGQSSRFTLSAMEKFRILEAFEQKGIRMTALIFAVDDPTAKHSAAETIRAFGDRVDYLLVENPAYRGSADFNKTPLRRWFAERNTPTILIPQVLEDTMSAWEAVEKKHKKYLPLDEACRHPDLHEIQQAELQFLRDRMLAQFEQCAERLVPDVALIKNRLPPEVARPPRQEIDPLDDPLY